MKYSRDILEEVVKKSTSIAGVLRQLNLQERGGNHTYIKSRIIYYGIDTSHFLGQKHGLGQGSNLRKKWSDILVKRTSGPRCKSLLLRRALIESGREYICSVCGQKPIWNNKELRLHVDHINGNPIDDRAENLRFICLHCHSQTEGYSGSKGYSGVNSMTEYSRRYRRKNSERVNSLRRIRRHLGKSE